MDKIFVKYKSPITVILLLILIGGAYSYKNLSTSLFPNVTFPKIKIIADNGQQPVDKMMVTVTKPLENAIKRVENLKLIRSITSMGSCEISAFMDWGSDINIDKQRLESRIAQIKNSLPPNTQIVVEKMNPSILSIMGYSLQSDVKNQVELKMIGEYIVKPYLSRIEGVAAIEVIGGKTKEFQVILDQKKLSTLKIKPQEIINAIQQTGFIQANGYTVDYKRLYLTVTDATINNKKQLENLVIFDNAKSKISLKDIATIQISEKTEYIKINADGKNVPLIAVLKQPNSNLIDVADKVTKSIEELNKILPKGVQLVKYYNQADFVSTSLKSIIDVLWIGLVLAIIVVMIFLRSFKASSVLLVTIPITLGLTFLVMKALGYDLNIMTIGAIAAAIGLIIDDAVIIVEQIHRTHEENPKEPATALVGKAIQFLFPAMVSSSLSTIVIFFPFALMTGVAGAYFKILTETMIITLAVSFVVTWIGLPVVYLLFSKKNPKEIKVHPLKERKWVRYFIERPLFSYAFILVTILSIVFVLPKLKTGFLPEMDEGSIILDYNSPSGTSLNETDRMLSEVDAILDQIPEVKAYSRRTGTQMGFFITEPNRGDYLIELKKNRKKTTFEVTDIIRKRVEGSIPALTVDFGQVITDMLGDLMSSVQPIEIKIFGTDHKKLQELSKIVAKKVENVKGTADVFNGIIIAGPMLSIHPKESILKQYGLSSSDLQLQIQTYLNGTIAGAILEKEQLTNIRVLHPDNATIPIEQLKEAKIATNSGTYLPLAIFADFSMKQGVSEIERENLQSMGVVTARLNNRDLGSVIHDIKKELAQLQLPPAYQIVYGGSYAEQQKSFNELLLILIFGGLLVFTVILFMFRNLMLSFIVIFVSVLGISGSVLALYFTNTPLNVGSYTGIIMIIGILGEASIFTIYLFLAEIKKRGQKEAIIYSISARLRPKLMTAISAIVALMPLALGIGTGAQMHQPLAIAVVGGFIIALPLLLIVLPTLVYKLASFKIEEKA
ncbi:Cobalt-zinc-cadmium resistance protein CzcA [Polaribacter huanghezhanensis]|uniref:efflux RND transporter permease subunit n=1 Tax=Polaribacter huanghezhanensis TaxID=1354726 RepID=UPI0026483DC1|nr:efflux RND transporter permease subunit [Polaribacter huanghezhanensis]WKD86647.1 Cobalt-zinc-cadmium resistance protein CzcA [Polaribacter huanghezhanensis]